MNTQTTSDTWTAAHTALCNGQWAAARDLLDQLGACGDNTHYLAGMAAYTKAHTCPPSYSRCLQDRICWVNMLAELN